VIKVGNPSGNVNLPIPRFQGQVALHREDFEQLNLPPEIADSVQSWHKGEPGDRFSRDNVTLTLSPDDDFLTDMSAIGAHILPRKIDFAWKPTAEENWSKASDNRVIGPANIGKAMSNVEAKKSFAYFA
jgi:hypothetical protein